MCLLNLVGTGTHGQAVSYLPRPAPFTQPLQAILRPKNQYLGGVPSVAWAQVQKDKSQFSFQGELWRRRCCCCMRRARRVGLCRLSLQRVASALPPACLHLSRPRCGLLLPLLCAVDHAQSACSALTPPVLLTFPSAGEGEGSYFHSSKLVTTAACNVQTIGRDVLYTPRIETRLKTGAHVRLCLLVVVVLAFAQTFARFPRMSPG